MVDFRRVKWDHRFLDLAEHIAQWSKDPSTKVGAVLVQGNQVVGLGYNGFPRGVDDTEERYKNRELKYKLVVHAEVNAILMAGPNAKGGTLYVWPSFMLPPICTECCKIAIQAGVAEIVGYKIDEDKLSEAQLRWRDSILVSREMCDEAKIRYRGVFKTV
jgi:dCMP deaminase